ATSVPADPRAATAGSSPRVPVPGAAAPPSPAVRPARPVRPDLPAAPVASSTEKAATAPPEPADPSASSPPDPTVAASGHAGHCPVDHNRHAPTVPPVRRAGDDTGLSPGVHLAPYGTGAIVYDTVTETAHLVD